jgi:hypothetical protein
VTPGRAQVDRILNAKANTTIETSKTIAARPGAVVLIPPGAADMTMPPTAHSLASSSDLIALIRASSRW